MGLVNETVHAFNSEYNLGNDKAKSLMPYCRPVVEKYVFSKLYDKLFAMYAIKNEIEDTLFAERSQTIKNQRPDDVMIYLGINKKFILSLSMHDITVLKNLQIIDSNRPSIRDDDLSHHHILSE